MSNCCCPPVIFGEGEPGPPGEGACISTDTGNQLVEGSDGCLYVPPAEPAEPAEPCLVDGGGLSQDEDGCLRVDTGDGLETGDDGIQLCLADEPDNQAQLVDGCLYVPPPAAESPGEPEPPCISEEADNQTRLDDSGCVYTPLPQIEIRSQIVVYEDDGTFDPADYPGLQYIRVRAVGGGGGSSGGVRETEGVTATITQSGGAGSYAESVFNADELPAGPIPVWVGKGGAGGQAAEPGEEPTPGQNGTWSSFGGGAAPDRSGLVIAMWGLGGGVDVEWSEVTDFGAMPGAPSYDQGLPFRSVGQITVDGGAGMPSIALGPELLGNGATLAIGGSGGANPLSSHNAGSMTRLHADRQGRGYGGSTTSGHVSYGGGGVSRVGAFPGVEPPHGTPGADGVVIVEVVTARLVMS